MRMDEFDYELPEELIAQEPLEDRSASRMIHVSRDSEEIEHRSFRDIVEILLPGDLLVMNKTRVSAIRLYGQKETGAKIELLLFDQKGNQARALIKPAKKCPIGTKIFFGEECLATVSDDEEAGIKKVVLAGDNWQEHLKTNGLAPLPPYIHHKLEDKARYQTVYSQEEGSLAAPTAGLHFTNDLLDALTDKGIKIGFVSLDVGLDTFRPIKAEKLEDHEIHGELCRVDETLVKQVKTCTGRVIAVGTTTVRTLETFAKDKRQLDSGEKVSKLFIQPGYEFRIVDGMLTNFHMPRTTMLSMLSAMIGQKKLMNAYKIAVFSRYRFLSFGDSMLIL